jgi:hypothetical protein
LWELFLLLVVASGGRRFRRILDVEEKKDKRTEVTQISSSEFNIWFFAILDCKASSRDTARGIDGINRGEQPVQ